MRLVLAAGGRPARSAIYRRPDDAIADLNERLGGLPLPAEADRVWAELWHQEAHHSTALEGNTLILAEVKKLLDEGRAVGDQELREHMEVLGYAAAAKSDYGQALAPGGWSASGPTRTWSLLSPTGDQSDMRVGYNAWRNMLIEAGVGHVRLHDGRHTAATLPLAGGENPRVVVEPLGHTQIDLAEVSNLREMGEAEWI